MDSSLSLARGSYLVRLDHRERRYIDSAYSRQLLRHRIHAHYVCQHHHVDRVHAE